MCGRTAGDVLDVMLMWSGKANPSDEERVADELAVGQFVADLYEAGVPVITGINIHASRNFTVVRGQQAPLADGPVTEVGERRRGYIVIELPNKDGKALEKARMWADRLPFPIVDVITNEEFTPAQIADIVAATPARVEHAEGAYALQREEIREGRYTPAQLKLIA
ncbi:hypothetical protein ABZW18_00840 [Streptomyces sp. NPDC004647]|uniref:hypothetical protein n=1 Tax=Streptomyces sp. NPDC004647 TaxID=3154671 RepID=UPI0033A7F8DA